MHPTDSTRPHGKNLLVLALAGEGALALCELDTATGALALLEKVCLPGAEGGCGGMPLATNRKGDRFYAAWRGEEPRLFSFELDSHALRLKFLSEASLPASMCYAMLSSCGRRLLTSSYTGSTIAISPVDGEGRAGEPLMVEEAMHAHCLVEAPNGLVYATSLRGDFIQIYAFDEARSSLRPIARRAVPAGSGPRHIVFSADGKSGYLLSEFSGTLTLFDVGPETGLLTPRQSVDLLPEGEKAWAAELRLSPGERFLYASERKTSQVFGYRLGGSREMQLVCAEPAPECPRAFGFDASGRHLIALGEKSGEARTYRVGQDGALDPVAQLQVGAAPSWVLATAL